MDLSGGVLLALAGFAAGAINAAAGGGSLVTFPALIAVGYPPLVANVTNNVAVSPGYATGAWGYRAELRGQRKRIVPLVAVSALGSLVGVGLILVSSQRAFDGVVSTAQAVRHRYSGSHGVHERSATSFGRSPAGVGTRSGRDPHRDRQMDARGGTVVVR